MSITNLRCEYLENPLCIERLKPLLSWTHQTGTTAQIAYQVQVASSTTVLEKQTPDLWDSGKVLSSQISQIEYAGTALKPYQQCFWQIRVWRADESVSAWSAVAKWSMGAIEQEQWAGKWLSYPVSGCHNAAYFRHEFSAKSPIQRAVVYATSRGIYEVHLNGKKVNDDFYSPGWTDYNKRIYYRAYEVTEQVQSGSNALGGVINEGWYKGPIGFQGNHALYGYETMLRLQLRIEYTDGSVEVIATDEAWKTSLGSVLQSNFLEGENVDLAHEPHGWNRVGFNDAAWSAPTIFVDGKEYWSQKHGTVRELKGNLEAHPAPPIRPEQEFKALKHWQTDPGSWVFDIGQNIAGWARIKVRGKPGTMLRLRFGEVLQSDKTLYVENLRAASSTDTYVVRSNDEEVWEPRFSFHGFQYVELTGVDNPALDAVVGVAISSDCKRTGYFECSHPGVNKLVSNAWWTQRANFIDIPTDCPQRDERLGWTGDALAFVNTAAYNADVSSFFIKWIKDVIDTQREDGSISNTAPDGCMFGMKADAAWADALTGCTWAIYNYYGEKRLLAEAYPAMKALVEYYKSTSENWLREKTHCFGDWLDDNDRTPSPILLTAYFAFSARICAQSAEVLGFKADQEKYRSWWKEIVTAFQKRFVSADGIIEGNSQTGIVVALDMDLLPEAQRQAAAQRLVDKLTERGYRLATGFVGTHLLLPVLSRFGFSDVAYKLLLQTKYPSWLFPIEQGATSIWERWNGWTPEAGPGNPSMNSYSHYSFGAVLEWLYGNVAGIKALSPGFERIQINPCIGAELDWVKCSYESQRGVIRSEWKKTGKQLQVILEIPGNTLAEFTAPGAVNSGLPKGGHRILADGVYELSSGVYQLEIELRA